MRNTTEVSDSERFFRKNMEKVWDADSKARETIYIKTDKEVFGPEAGTDEVEEPKDPFLNGKRLRFSELARLQRENELLAVDLIGAYVGGHVEFSDKPSVENFLTTLDLATRHYIPKFSEVIEGQVPCVGVIDEEETRRDRRNTVDTITLVTLQGEARQNADRLAHRLEMRWQV